VSTTRKAYTLVTPSQSTKSWLATHIQLASRIRPEDP
jgi:hypothetical protein